MKLRRKGRDEVGAGEGDQMLTGPWQMQLSVRSSGGGSAQVHHILPAEPGAICSKQFGNAADVAALTETNWPLRALVRFNSARRIICVAATFSSHLPCVTHAGYRPTECMPEADPIALDRRNMV